MDDHSHSEVATLLESAVKVPVEEAPFSELNYTLCYPKNGKPPRPCPC